MGQPTANTVEYHPCWATIVRRCDLHASPAGLLREPRALSLCLLSNTLSPSEDRHAASSPLTSPATFSPMTPLALLVRPPQHSCLYLRISRYLPELKPRPLPASPESTCWTAQKHLTLLALLARRFDATSGRFTDARLLLPPALHMGHNAAMVATQGLQPMGQPHAVLPSFSARTTLLLNPRRG